MPTNNCRAEDIKIYRLDDSWRAKVTTATANSDFQNNVISISILLSKQYDLAE